MENQQEQQQEIKSTQPIVKVTGRIQDLEKTEQNVKPTHSNYLVTINTNQQYKDDKENLKNDVAIFDDIINNVLNDIENYIKLPEGITFDQPHIQNCDVDYVVEVGTIRSQIHVHIMIKITHFTRVQLDYVKLKNTIKTKLGLKNIYMQSKLLRPSASDNILDYLAKFTNNNNTTKPKAEKVEKAEKLDKKTK